MITLCLDAFVLEGREPSFLLSASVFIMSGVMCRIHHPRFKIITIALSGGNGVQRHSYIFLEVYDITLLFLLKLLQIKKITEVIDGNKGQLNNSNKSKQQ